MKKFHTRDLNCSIGLKLARLNMLERNAVLGLVAGYSPEITITEQSRTDARTEWESNYAVVLKNTLGLLGQGVLVNMRTINAIACDVYVTRASSNKYANIHPTMVLLKKKLDVSEMPDRCYEVIHVVLGKVPKFIVGMDAKLSSILTNVIYNLIIESGVDVHADKLRLSMEYYVTCNRITQSGMEFAGDHDKLIFETLVNTTLDSALLPPEKLECPDKDTLLTKLSDIAGEMRWD